LLSLCLPQLTVVVVVVVVAVVVAALCGFVFVVVARDVYPPNCHDATLPLDSLLSAPLLFLLLPSPFTGKFLELQILVSEF